MPDKQAEAVIKLMAQQGEDLVTKADIEVLRADMTTKIAATNAEITATKAEITALRADMATKATKADITALRADMATKADIKAIKTEMTALRSGIKADTAELKASIFLALFAAMGLMIATMVAVNKLL